MSDNTVWPDSLMIRDTKLYDDLGGMGQRIYTTAGNGYKKQKYVRADLIEAQAAELDRLRAELERERMRLAACGVVALANTPESAKAAREMHPDYHSASLDDVARAVDQQIALRAAVTALVPIVQRDRELIGERDEYRAERDAALRLADEAMGERAA